MDTDKRSSAVALGSFQRLEQKWTDWNYYVADFIRLLWYRDLLRAGDRDTPMGTYKCSPSRQHDFEDIEWKRLQFVRDHGGSGERKCPGDINEYTRASWFDLQFGRQFNIPKWSIHWSFYW